uniref:Ribosomal protein S9 n=1 Tax=Trepomonas sp. PC1 TaxID=1076344 RepID=A0A146K4E9_9EUKA|eukprot:JAP91762.1 Ribosomal protein S9 [Trepomonas sp. PC1]
MPSVSRLRSSSKSFNTPRRPFNSPRIKSELELVGKYGLRCKREIYRAKFMLSKIRKTARKLLTLEAENPIRKFEGDALMRRLHVLGVLENDKNELDYVLSLKIDDLLKRRLQTVISDNSTTKTIHQARVWIKHGHIQVGNNTVNVPGFLVRSASEKYIKIAEQSPFGSNGKAGRCARKNAKK